MPNRSEPVVTGRSVSFLSSTQDPDLYPGSDMEWDIVIPSSLSTSTTTHCSSRIPPPHPYPSYNPSLPSQHALITSTHPPVPSKNRNHCPLSSTPKA
ncbi:hypothetical protein L873DRAFT_1807421 [Choiromyces venosus 120613-1]|uniref:Uncharacterized protein n=1 Tax=Choiromyces venosus 120613-1 TaxID=1336337 RepID=A0A3N4JL77_9PEZI|nr:hypothetical protein L873DRAFT_1807421 [Choiromyces venosus 120613-1]